MPGFTQRLVPGIVGISTYVDCVYHREIQSAALAASGEAGPINRLRSVIVTLDFKRLLENVHAGQIGAAEDQVAAAATALEAGGADFIVVTSGTTSTLTARAREQVSIPFLDLAEAAVAAAAAAGPVLGLLSTRRAAEGGIFQAAAERRRLTLLIPSASMAERVDDAIFRELVLGRVTEASVRLLGDAVAELARGGAQAVILGNTDMTLAAEALAGLARVPLIDSARAHGRAAARAAMSGQF